MLFVFQPVHFCFLDSTENQPNQRQVKKVRRVSATERRIHDLTVNMRMKEELIKELDRTGASTWSKVSDWLLIKSKHDADNTVSAKKTCQRLALHAFVALTCLI